MPPPHSHVGTVVHAFENLAYQRQLHEGERPYESSKSSSNDKKDSIYKIILPPPSVTDPSLITPPKQIVRPKGKAPDVPSNTVSATTQTRRHSAANENDSSALDSINLEDEFPHATAVSDYPYHLKSYKVLPPFIPAPPRQPSRIPTKLNNKAPPQDLSKNKRLSDSLLLKPSPEDDNDSDFLRGSTVSQSFIKNVVRKSPERKPSTYEQNFLMNNDGTRELKNRVKRRGADRAARDHRSRSESSKLEEPLIDEVSKRYKEYGGSAALKNRVPKPFTKFQGNFDHAEI